MQTKAFLYKHSDSLYVYNNRLTGNNKIGPQISAAPAGPVRSTVPVSYGASGSVKKPFQIAPVVYLDRYEWAQRSTVETLREEQFVDGQEMGKLAAQTAKLGVYKKTDQDIISDQEKDVTKALEDGDKKKALLKKTLAHLKQASEAETDEKRKASQLALLDRLTKVEAMLRDQVTRKSAAVRLLYPL